MAKMIEVLRQTVSPAIVRCGFDMQEIGNKIYVKLDETRRVEMCFDTAGYQGNYEVLFFKLTDKNKGELHRQGVKFKDLLGAGKMVSDDFNGGYKWLRATETDIEKVRNVVVDYIEMWR